MSIARGRGFFCFDAFSSREPVSTSLENALGYSSAGFTSTRPSTTLADFERHGIPKSVFL